MFLLLIAIVPFSKASRRRARICDIAALTSGHFERRCHEVNGVVPDRNSISAVSQTDRSCDELQFVNDNDAMIASEKRRFGFTRREPHRDKGQSTNFDMSASTED
jgi:hypothetical protein